MLTHMEQWGQEPFIIKLWRGMPLRIKRLTVEDFDQLELMIDSSMGFNYRVVELGLALQDNAKSLVASLDKAGFAEILKIVAKANNIEGLVFAGEHLLFETWVDENDECVI